MFSKQSGCQKCWRDGHASIFCWHSNLKKKRRKDEKEEGNSFDMYRPAVAPAGHGEKSGGGVLSPTGFLGDNFVNFSRRSQKILGFSPGGDDF